MHPPRFPKNLPGTLWGIAAYFNPAKFASRHANYRVFREAARRQGLKLITVEAALGDVPFQLESGDADILVQLRTDAVLWHKERLLNIALKHLPPECDKVVWLDTDVLFDRDDWILKTAAALESFAVVQPFSIAVQLPPGRREPGDGETKYATAVAWAASNLESFVFSGDPGYACGVRRDIIQETGFYDRGILGAGDTYFMTACLGVPPGKNPYIEHHGSALFRDMDPWFRGLHDSVRGSVSFVDGRLFHLWHGDRSKRLYHERALLLRDFDPQRDIELDSGGCWRWATDKKKLHDDVRGYFVQRNEDTTLMEAVS